MTEVRIRIYTKETGYVNAVFFDDYSPKTFNEVLRALPIRSKAMRWGDEVYFNAPVHVGVENGREVVDKGTIAFWPPGDSLCIFWGPTPASRRPDEIRPASSVNVIGKVIDDPSIFSRVREGSEIVVEKA